jgi:hypothetical protein
MHPLRISAKLITASAGACRLHGLPGGGDCAGAMAYDAATGTVVLFGGEHESPSGGGWFPRGTWTWDGTAWTRQHPATSPSGRFWPAMAYDAATGTVVLFGGLNHHERPLDSTWTWDGTTWTKQHPATSPPARFAASMAYDAVTGTVVLFGGSTGDGETWTWDGSTWTRQHPATSPPARSGAGGMAYDAATGTVVLFGGRNFSLTYAFADTWTWDGSTWTKQHPATHPSSRLDGSMAYEAATGSVVLFGGSGYRTGNLHDTWTWG